MSAQTPSSSSAETPEDSTAKRRAEQSKAALENTSKGYSGGAEADPGAYNPPQGLLDKISGKPDKPADSGSGNL